METLSVPFLATIGANETRPLMLVEIGFSPVLRLATRATTWNGYLWAADRVLEVSNVTIGDAGHAAATVAVGNHDDLLGGYQLNQRLRGRPVSAWEAWLDTAGAMHIRLRITGTAGRVRLGADLVSIEIAGGSAVSHAPRTLIRHLVGWPPPKPEGYQFSWGGQSYVMKRRQ